jgi:NADH-ubiquinone oxidoreductase chain 5
MYLSIIILPLLGSLVSGFLGRKVGTTGSQIITCTSLLITSVLITIAFYEVGLCGSVVRIELGSWIDSELMNISWEFYFDQLTVSLGLAVVYCSTLIHIYSIDYLSTDPAQCFGKTLKWVKLSNSGDVLKLMIPNYIRKSISG